MNVSIGLKKNKNKALGNKDCLFRVIKNNDYY